MCLRIIPNFKTRREAREFSKKPKVAKTNMTVYKVLDGPYWNTRNPKGHDKYYSSPHRSMVYKDAELKKAKAFSFEHNKMWALYADWYINVNKGLHAYKSLKAVGLLSGKAIAVKCKIPKGTKYFEGTHGEIVALKLQMPKIIKHCQ